MLDRLKRIGLRMLVRGEVDAFEGCRRSVRFLGLTEGEVVRRISVDHEIGAK